MIRLIIQFLVGLLPFLQTPAQKKRDEIARVLASIRKERDERKKRELMRNLLISTDTLRQTDRDEDAH